VHVQGSGGVITDGTAVDASVPMQRFDAGGITAIDTGVLQVGVQRVVGEARRTTARAIADPLSSVPGPASTSRSCWRSSGPAVVAAADPARSRGIPRRTYCGTAPSW